MLNVQGQEWWFVALPGPKGALGCCSEWMSLRCRTSGSWPYLVLITRALLVARDDQPDAAIHKNLHMLSTVWGQLVQGPFTSHHGYCSPRFLHVDFTNIETTLEPNQLPRVTNILVFQDHFTNHVLTYVTPHQTAKTITNSCTKATSPSLEPQPGSWVWELLTSWVV